MIKLLLLPEVFETALTGTSPAAGELLEKCRREDEIQGWVLAGTFVRLVEAGWDREAVKTSLTGICQIPLNALLNEKAAALPGDFNTALHRAAAEIFKIHFVIGGSAMISGVEGWKTVEQALQLDEKDMPPRVDFLNLNWGLHPIFERLDGWFMETIQNTAFIGGNHLAAFETEFAAFCGADHAIGVANGTDALRFALLALGIKSGDEVITVPNTFIATTEAISQVGARPVFVDIDPRRYTMDPALIEAKITSRTRAILPVHLYGQLADMEPILKLAQRHGLKVLEDACQAHGARYRGKRAGTWGQAAAFSMYPGKNLGAFGEAGCVVTNDPAIAETIRCLRDHGQIRKYYHRLEGFNGRLDNLQAAVLRAKLPFLEAGNARRRDKARYYGRALQGLPGLVLPLVVAEEAHVFHQFVILVPDAKGLAAFLEKREIHTGFHYPVPLHLQEAYSHRAEGIGSYPVTERCARQLLSLPMYPELSRSQLERVCTAIRAYRESGPLKAEGK